jgi:hypothetical protein
VLLREGRAALQAVEAAERRTRRAALAAAGRAGVVLVTKAGASSELLAELLAAHAAEPGAPAVDVLLCGIGEQGRLLRDGRADVALLHRPFDTTTGLDTEELRTEGQVVVLPAGHLSPPGPACGRSRSPRCPTCPCRAGPRPTGRTRTAPARRSATTRSCSS